jgi:hypothetical protein
MTLKEFDEFCEMYSEIKLPFWMQARIETITEHHMKKLKSIWGTSDSNIFAVGNTGTMLHYNGTSWSTIPPLTAMHLYDIWGINDTVRFADSASVTVKLIEQAISVSIF